MNFTAHPSEPILWSILRQASRTLLTFMVAVPLVPVSGLAEKAGGSKVYRVLGSEPLQFIGKLEQLRAVVCPLPASGEDELPLVVMVDNRAEFQDGVVAKAEE